MHILSLALKSFFRRVTFGLFVFMIAPFSNTVSNAGQVISVLTVQDLITSENSGTAQVKVSLLPVSTQRVTVKYASKPGTAIPGEDFIGVSNTLTFNPGETSKTINIKIINDTAIEAKETFPVRIFTPINALIGDDAATISIADDDRSALTVHDVIASENAGSTQVMVSLLPASTKTVTVNYASKPGTAIPGEDFIGISNTLTFNPGETSKTINVKIVNDTAVEGEERFPVRIFTATNALISRDAAAVRILDNDAPTLIIKPSVKLLSPGNSTTYTVNSGIQIKAEAADADGYIKRVEFYDNGSLLGAATASPYVFNWNSATIGTHDLSVKAVDDSGNMSASAVNRITVTEAAAATGSLVVYPAPQDVASKYMSTRFSVTVSQNGINKGSPVYQSNNSAHPSWAGTLDYMQTANHWTTFSFGGSVNVEAKRLDGKAIQTCVIRPLALNIQPTIQGDKCNFTLSKPAKVSVEIDENYSKTASFKDSGLITKHVIKHPLFVFADPLEVNIPTASAPGVLYFGPGIHVIGKKYQLNNDTQVYIAGGAVVIGNFTSSVKDPKNISIRGRGILSAIGLTETTEEYNQWGNQAIDFSKGINGSNLLVEGITITDPLRSCIVSYNSMTIRNVKMFSWESRNDGITAGRNSLIEDNFIKVEDDNIKLYYSYQTVRRNVVWQQTTGAVFKFSWSLSGVSQGHQVSDIDVIHSDVFYDYEGAETDRPDMCGDSAIFAAMGFNKDAAFKNALFKDIRVEEKHLLQLMSLRMVTMHQHPTDPTKNSYWGDPATSASKLIDGVILENVQLAGVPYKNSTLYGNYGGIIRNINFRGLKINGKVINNVSPLISVNSSTGLLTAGNVQSVTFAE